jgi:DNA-damage-inducible protein J
MALTATIRARVDEDLKAQAQDILAEIGITTSQLINMTLKKLVAEKDIPFDTKIPSDRLQSAIDEVNNGIGSTHQYNSIDDLMLDLKNDL